MRFGLAIIVWMLAVPAFAADDARLKKLCLETVQHTPSEDVTYQPGKDVYWRDVAPADLDAPPTIVPGDTITLGITFDTAKQMNLPDVSYTPQMYVGTVDVRKDGTVLFNGKPLNRPQMQVLCEEINNSGRK